VLLRERGRLAIKPATKKGKEMSTIHATQLAAKVAARNRVGKLALEQLPNMISALQPFIGKKVLNQGAVISAKVRAALPDYPQPEDGGCAGFSDHWYYRGSKYSISVEFRTCESYRTTLGNECVTYAEESFTIGEIEGDSWNLKATRNGQTAKTSWTVEEVQGLRVKVQKAQDDLYDAQAELWPFEMFDN
jgi:hypothetical protein